MSAISVLGLGVLSGAGLGPAVLAEAWSGAGDELRPGHPDRLYPDDRGTPDGHPVVDFDVRTQLGRKGTSTLDRATALALVAVGQAIADAGLTVDDESRGQIGLVLGTTAGSLKSTSDYSRETLVEERPYLVNPMLFPNTVMNRAAGQSAIWYGLKGVNATVAGGPMAFLHVLRYASNALARRHADVVLAGAVEEFTPHSARLAAAYQPDLSAGEGAVVAVLRRAGDGPGGDAARGGGVRGDAELLAVVNGFAAAPDDDAVTAALAGCLRRALQRADVDADAVSLAITGDTGTPGGELEARAVAAALGGRRVEQLRVKRLLGEGQAASGALGFAAALGRHRGDPALDGRVSVLTAHSQDGGVGAAVMRGWARAGTDRG